MQYGKKYRVNDWSGLDSGRTGTYISYSYYRDGRDREGGRPFDREREAMLEDSNGNVFVMYMNRLTKVL